MATLAKADQIKAKRSKRVLQAMADVYGRAAEGIEQRLRDAKKNQSEGTCPPPATTALPMTGASVDQTLRKFIPLHT
jgi:hypothetical protein